MITATMKTLTMTMIRNIYHREYHDNHNSHNHDSYDDKNGHFKDGYDKKKVYDTFSMCLYFSYLILCF